MSWHKMKYGLQEISEVILVLLAAGMIFVIVYVLFSFSSILFPVDRDWYASLKKPVWTPSGRIIGMIWGLLYALIALSIAIVEYKVGLRNTSVAYMVLWAINYVANQAFSYFQFKLKSLDLATLDAALVAITALLLTFVTAPYSLLAAILLIPYVIWSVFATYLAWTIYRQNQ